MKMEEDKEGVGNGAPNGIPEGVPEEGKPDAPKKQARRVGAKPPVDRKYIHYNSHKYIIQLMEQRDMTNIQLMEQRDMTTNVKKNSLHTSVRT